MSEPTDLRESYVSPKKKKKFVYLDKYEINQEKQEETNTMLKSGLIVSYTCSIVLTIVNIIILRYLNII
jgi:hypothetical protein